MRTILLISCLFYLQVSAQSEKTISASEIKEVKIYQVGAQVSRHLKTSIEAGITELKLDGLSANIDKNSISVSGNGDVIILSVVHEMNYLNNVKKTTEQRKLEDSLETLQYSLEKISNTEATYKEEQELLRLNKSTGGANVGVSMENLQKVAEFFRNRMNDIYSKLSDIHREQKKINEKITLVQQQLNEINAKRNQPTSTITVALSSKINNNISLDVTYYVTGAGWSPRYDIRSKDISSPVQLAYKANVFQRTGENWDNVKLKLSTGNPSLSGSKPELYTWYLDFNYPVRYKSGMNEKEKYSVPVTMEEIQSAPSRGDNSAAQTTANYTQVNENQLSTDFDIAIPYTIPSDGKMHSVDIQSYSINATYSYFAIPKLDKDAFLVARISGWEELNLMPGQANIYFEGAYVGESTINPGTTDTLDLSLGRDKKIVITREKKKDLSSTKFIGSNIEKELNYLITVRNTKKEKINITIEDQVPVSKNNDIVVKLGEHSGGLYNEATGKITWKLDVSPASKSENQFNFSVKYPKDKVVSGL